ncbi:MAG: phospholipase D-like domain-containing protein [Anaerolineales bacterium]|jgi:phosphatidylserine/phosphatidylglycerophosphate/cardiolipin synthase-like enzyme
MFRRFSVPSILAALATLLISSLCVIFQTSNPETDAAATPTSNPTRDSICIFFSDPGGSASSTYRGGPDALLAQAIDEARYSIDIAMYNLDLWSVRDALLRAYRRGLTVRMVTDSDNILESEIQELLAADIPLLGDRREPLMHHKFVVIDRLEVWTGSMNMTVSGAYRNDNNLVCIRSPELAADYTREFEEMFLEDRFGALSLRDTPHPLLNIDGVSVEVYFSPDDDPATRIIELLFEADESIDFMVYAFTSDPIADAMLARSEAGVIVRGVIERGQAANAGSDFDRLSQSEIDLRLDANERNMHHKVIVIDGETVITGSYNFSRSAQEFNDENVLVLHDVSLAEQFLIEFERIFEMAEP